MNYYCEHNICPMLTTLPEQTDTIMLYRNVHFQQISSVLGISMEELRALNPQYRRDVITGYSEPTDLRLPMEYVSKYIANEDSILAYKIDEQLMKRDMVEVNDDTPAYRPARSSSHSSNKYQRDNRRSNRKKSKKSRRNRESSASVSIKSGDTLEKIAKKHGTTVAKLKKLNKISGSNIRAGKKLKIR